MAIRFVASMALVQYSIEREIHAIQSSVREGGSPYGRSFHGAFMLGAFIVDGGVPDADGAFMPDGGEGGVANGASKVDGGAPDGVFLLEGGEGGIGNGASMLVGGTGGGTETVGAFTGGAGGLVSVPGPAA